MIKISNGLLKCHIDIRRKLFKAIINNFGGKLRIILYGGAALDKDTIIGFNNFGIDSIQGYGLTETSPVLVAESETKHKPGSAGYALDNVKLKIEETTIDGKKVFSVADGYLIACFDKDISEETVKMIAQKQPYYAVFRDGGMASDSVATNFEQIFEAYSPQTQRRIL